MARIAENTVIVDGQEYKPGDVIPDFKSIKCVDTREPRKYQGLSADVSVLNDVIAKYASGGASCFMSDTGEYYEYDRKEKAWKLITNITERGFDSEKAYGALKHMLKNVTVSDEKLTIDSTEVVAYNCTQSWVEMARGTHSLALSHHISVRIDTGNDKKAVISVTDETGKTYELQTEWVCGHGDVVVENENGNYTKCKLTFYPSEYRQKVWAYGDSYFDLWPWICNAKGARHWMIDGFSGRGSTDALKSLKLALKHATPSIVLWCLGMNDPDTETEISASWLENIKKVKAICDENNITLIPTTIPNVPTRNHSFKNTYVRENFSRYVDISESLGAEISTSWYSGLLPVGDIHPSDAGRALIAQKVMSEVPEII